MCKNGKERQERKETVKLIPLVLVACCEKEKEGQCLRKPRSEYVWKRESMGRLK